MSGLYFCCLCTWNAWRGRDVANEREQAMRGGRLAAQALNRWSVNDGGERVGSDGANVSADVDVDVDDEVASGAESEGRRIGFIHWVDGPRGKKCVSHKLNRTWFLCSGLRWTVVDGGGIAWCDFACRALVADWFAGRWRYLTLSFLKLLRVWNFRSSLAGTSIRRDRALFSGRWGVLGRSGLPGGEPFTPLLTSKGFQALL